MNAQYAQHTATDPLFLLRLDLPPGLYAFQYAFTILVQLQLSDDNFRGVDADGDRLTR
jgi:hypothetical protein